jgi:hypothetical protein
MCAPQFQAYYYSCGGSDQHWNHNYYLYQEDETNVSKQEFRLVGWDVDSTWVDEETLNHHLGELKSKFWDTPICASGDCFQCKPYRIGTGQQLPPGCFPGVRAFARGLRSDYMDAANELLSGPLQLCRLQSKIDRWKAALAAHIQKDESAGLLPATRHCKWGSLFSGSGDWNAEVAKFRDTVVPWYVQRFRKSVACSRNYNANDWISLGSAPQISPMLRLNEWKTDSWMPDWLGGGQCRTSGTSGNVIGCQLSVVVVLSLLTWM